MKKWIPYIAALCCALLTAVSCSKEEIPEAGAAKGAMTMKISATRTDATPGYDPMDNLTVRIYNSEGLVRKYTSLETLPESLELLAGKYRVMVEAGQTERTDTKGAASFELRSYRGEETFTVVAGQTIPVEVLCKCLNTIVEVKFDNSVPGNFDTFHTWVAAGDTFDEQLALDGEVPALKYTRDAKGYFDLLDVPATLVWQFSGEHASRGTIEKSGVMTQLQPGRKYLLSLAFSPDLPGYIEGFSIAVDPSTDTEDDTLVFSPDPVIEGVDFDLSQVQEYISGEKHIVISTVKPMQEASLTIDGQSIDLIAALDGSVAGITAVMPDVSTLNLTLSDPLFAGRTGGNHTLRFSVNDTAGGAISTPATFRLQGIVPPTAADWDLWTNTVTLRIVQLEPEIPAPKFGLRTANGTWHEADGVLGSDGNYTASFTAGWTEGKNTAGLTVYTPVAGSGVFAGNDYECRATIGGTASQTTFSTGSKQVIPDGNMESGSLPCFAGNSENSPFWASGNAATSGLCRQSTKAGMGGNACALLKPGVTVGNLAAGNLFTATFKFASLKGTVYFGVPYTWTARPKALQFKYHAKVGRVNYGSDKVADYEYIKDGQDCSRIFVSLVEWNKRHEVTAGLGNPTGTWDPATTNQTSEGRIIGYGAMEIKSSTAGDSMVAGQIDLLYYDMQTKPSSTYTLIISCATSAYGDYKIGCDSNELFIDDFEWVY